MVIKMTDDKSLLITIPTTIYRGEKRADVLRFLVPAEYQGVSLANCGMMLKYIRPNGSGRSEALSYVPELYKGYLQYNSVVNTRITADEGVVTLWLTAYDDNDAVVLKTGELEINVLPSKDITDYMSDEDKDRFDEINERINILERTKADNIVCSVEEQELQLTSNGELIGEPVDLGLIPGISEDVIHFETSDSESDTNTGADSSTDTDDVIHF